MTPSLYVHLLEQGQLPVFYQVIGEQSSLKTDLEKRSDNVVDFATFRKQKETQEDYSI